MLRGIGDQFASVLSNKFGWQSFTTGQNTPQRGDILVWTSGQYGHVAVLLGKNNDGSYKIAESSSTTGGTGFPPKISSINNITGTITARP